MALSVAAKLLAGAGRSAVFGTAALMESAMLLLEATAVTATVAVATAVAAVGATRVLLVAGLLLLWPALWRRGVRRPLTPLTPLTSPPPAPSTGASLTPSPSPFAADGRRWYRAQEDDSVGEPSHSPHFPEADGPIRFYCDPYDSDRSLSDSRLVLDPTKRVRHIVKRVQWYCDDD